MGYSPILSHHSVNSAVFLYPFVDLKILTLFCSIGIAFNGQNQRFLQQKASFKRGQ